MDMDGVLVHEETAIPGAERFLARLRESGTPFLVLTNNSIYTRRDLPARLAASGLDVPETSLWTSALATARFLEDQRPGGSAFVSPARIVAHERLRSPGDHDTLSSASPASATPSLLGHRQWRAVRRRQQPGPDGAEPGSTRVRDSLGRA